MANLTSINGSWLIRPVNEFSDVWLNEAVSDGWIEQEVPGHWQQLQELKTYTGKVIYRKSFPFEPVPGRVYRLRAKGVFYRYRAFLNGFYLGDGEGYFVPSDFNITSSLKPGENTLVFEVDSINESELIAKTRMMGAYNGRMGLAPDCNPGGIWQPVEILETESVYIQSWNLWTEEASRDEARLSLQVNINMARIHTGLRLKLSLTPESEAHAERLEWEWSLESGLRTITWETKLTIDKPRLWWSWDLGEPALYQAKIEIYDNNHMALDQAEIVFGIRRFELRNYIPYLNGQRFFAKGANYAPVDLYPVMMTPERYAEDLHKAKAIHINMLRVYSHVEADAFYEAADRAGILLWQDTTLYGRYNPIVKFEAIRQVKEMVKRLGNHPSVAVWCMHEEPCGHKEFHPKGFFGGLDFLRPLLFSWNRDRLDRTLKAMVSSWDKTRPVVANTGARGWMLDCNGHLSYGWLPGHGHKRRFEWLRHGMGRRRLRFVTQLGGEKPSLDHETIHFSAAAGEALDWDRQALRRQRLTVSENNNAIPSGELYSSEDTGYDSKVELLRYYVDRLRYHKYRPTGGVLATFLYAPYPASQQSLFSFDNSPTPAYATLALAFRPVYIFTLLEKDHYYRGETVEAPICLACDRLEIMGAIEIKARLTGPSGDLVWKGRWEITPTSDMETMEIARASILLTRSGTFTLHLSWDDGEPGENVYYIPVKAFRHHKS